jgi:hypothetical protein
MRLTNESFPVIGCRCEKCRASRALMRLRALEDNVDRGTEDKEPDQEQRSDDAPRPRK